MCIRTDKIHQIVMKSRGTLMFNTIKTFSNLDVMRKRTWERLIFTNTTDNRRTNAENESLSRAECTLEKPPMLPDLFFLFIKHIRLQMHCFAHHPFHSSRKKKHISCLHFSKCDTCFGKQGDFEKSCQWHKTKSVNHKSSVWAFHARLPPTFH